MTIRPSIRRSRRSSPRDYFLALESRVFMTATPIGVNLENVSDWSRSLIFADAMKSARHFGSVNAPWDESAPIDANGWPTGDAGATIMTGQVNIGGTYAFSATGNVTVTPVASNATVTNWAYNAATNTTTASVVVASGETQLHLDFTGAAGGAKNIHLYRPGTTAADTFTPAFLASLQSATTLRLMDFTATNGNTVVSWSDRAHLTDATQATSKGTAWEYGIALANTLHKDLWINVPVGATKDYVTQLATLLKSTLDAGNHVYVEYSNEVWNSSFGQYSTNYNAAQTDEAANPSDLNWDNVNNTYQWAWRRIASQIVDIKNTFASVYGAAATDTIRPVLASQIGYSYVLKDQLDYLEHRFGGDLSGQLYAVAGAPYLNIGDLSSSSTLTVDQVFAALNQSLQDSQIAIQKYETLAAQYHVNNLYYEGGIDLQGDTGGNFANAKLPANTDPRMYDVVKNYLLNAYANGVDQVVYYSHVGPYTPWGTWGLTHDVNNLNTPKFNAFVDATNNATPAISSGNTLSAASQSLTVAGGSYLLDFWSSNGSGGALQNVSSSTKITYLLNATASGAYTIQLNAGSPYDGGQVEVLLDNQSVGILSIPNTGSLTTYGNTLSLNLAPGNATLAAGHHALTLRGVSGYLTLNSFTITPAQPASVPLTPTGFTATTVDSASIKLAWTDVTGETGYKLERSLDGATWSQLSLLPADTTAYTDTGLAAGTTYYYRVRATNTVGDSPTTSPVSATTTQAVIKLAAPSTVSARPVSASAISVSWSAVSGASAYLVERSLDGKTWFTVSQTSATSLTNSGLQADTLYYYRVSSISITGTLSTPSKTVSARTRRK